MVVSRSSSSGSRISSIHSSSNSMPRQQQLLLNCYRGVSTDFTYRRKALHVTVLVFSAQDDENEGRLLLGCGFILHHPVGICITPCRRCARASIHQPRNYYEPDVDAVFEAVCGRRHVLSASVTLFRVDALPMSQAFTQETHQWQQIKTRRSPCKPFDFASTRSRKLELKLLAAFAGMLGIRQLDAGRTASFTRYYKIYRLV